VPGIKTTTNEVSKNSVLNMTLSSQVSSKSLGDYLIIFSGGFASKQIF